MWATYNGPIVDAPGSYSGTSSYMGRANAFFTVLPYWKSFYESNADGSQKDVRRDVNFVDYAYVWNATTETQDKSYTASSIAKSLYRYPGKWRREWMAFGFCGSQPYWCELLSFALCRCCINGCRGL